MSLPHQDTLNLCLEGMKQHSYDLRSIREIESFEKQIQDLVSKYIYPIELRHLRRQKDAEREQMNEFSDEEGSNSNSMASLIEKEGELQESSEEEILVSENEKKN